MYTILLAGITNRCKSMRYMYEEKIIYKLVIIQQFCT